MNVDWGKIKNGCHGFEKMSLAFVKDQFPNPSWHKTKETRDGNKDGVAYVFGYQASEKAVEQWWMEAKYSTSKQYVTRYRLDATIVSAILQGKVKKVVFVTNILIRTKTISDIRIALLESTQCKEIVFCTRYMLEYWLAQKEERYSDYFEVEENSILALPPQPFIMQEIEFFEKSANKHAFCEPIYELITNNVYVGHFSIFSPIECTARLKKHRNTVGVKVLSKHTYHLSVGENTLQFEMLVTPRVATKQLCAFRINELELLPAQTVQFIQSQSIQYALPNQINMIKDLNQHLIKFIRHPRHQIHALYGIDGVGKSTVLAQLEKSDEITKNFFLHIGFSSSSIHNSQLLVDIVFFILFPYLSSDSIDEHYLSSLDNSHILSDLVSLTKFKYNYEKLIAYFSKIVGTHNLLPLELHVNKRIVFLDDVDKLDSTALSFLFELLTEAHEKKVPLLCVCTLTPGLLLSSPFSILQEKCCVYQHHLILDLIDIDTILNHRILSERCLGRLPQVSIVELLVFALYLQERGDRFERLDEFLALFRLFQLSDIVSLHIKSKFNSVFTTLPNCRKLCDLVYYSYVPYELQESDKHMRAEIALLIEQGLVSFTHYHCLKPAQETYRTLYRRFFSNNSSMPNILYNLEDDPEALRVNLESQYDIEILKKNADYVLSNFCSKRYNTVIYILQDLFETDSSRRQFEERLHDKVVFNKLYFAYTYASNQQSYTSTPKAHYERILEFIQNNRNTEERRLCLRINWELMVIDFDYLNYSKSLNRIKDVIILLRDMRRQGQITNSLLDCLQYHDAMTMKSLIEMELFGETKNEWYDIRLECSRNHHFLDRNSNTLIRLSLARIIYNVDRSISDLSIACSYFYNRYGEKDKMYLFGEFSLLYFQVVFYNKTDLFQDVICIHEKMKDMQYNNYRKRLFSISTYYFAIGDVANGNKYLFKEMYMTRELSTRSKAFFYETEALFELSQGHLSAAINSLEKAMELFGGVPTYQCIPMHNIKYLKTSECARIQYSFWKGETMDSKVYYLDPRITW